MGPVTIEEYIELICNRIDKLEELIDKETRNADPQANISPQCEKLIREYHTAFEFFKYMHQNRPQVIDTIRAELNITN